MAKLDIVLYPDPVLTQTAKPVGKVTPEIQQLVDDMVETMYAAPGIGLAAPQIGRSLRICVIDVANPADDEEPDLHVLINPEITAATGTITWEEGCLSLPGLFREVKRAAAITVEALDRNGDFFRVEADGLLAVCMQHEIDHLDGVMFPERLSSLKKRLAFKEWRRLKDRLNDEGDDDSGREAGASI